jgi:hypothetical protein
MVRIWEVPAGTVNKCKVTFYTQKEIAAPKFHSEPAGVAECLLLALF